jgi:hypothetical protein
MKLTRRKFIGSSLVTALAAALGVDATDKWRLLYEDEVNPHADLLRLRDTGFTIHSTPRDHPNPFYQMWKERERERAREELLGPFDARGDSLEIYAKSMSLRALPTFIPLTLAPDEYVVTSHVHNVRYQVSGEVDWLAFNDRIVAKTRPADCQPEIDELFKLMKIDNYFMRLKPGTWIKIYTSPVDGRERKLALVVKADDLEVQFLSASNDQRVITTSFEFDFWASEERVAYFVEGGAWDRL